MALSKCYECGNQVSTQATACPHCGAPQRAVPPQLPPTVVVQQPPKKKGIGFFSGCFIVLLALFTIGIISSAIMQVNRDTGTSSTTPSSPPFAQTTVRLKGDSIGNAPNRVALVAGDEASLVEMMKLLVAKDVRGVVDLIAQDRGTLLREGTQVRVLQRKTIPGTSATIFQIRVLEGDLEGRTVWTHSFFVP